MAAARLAEVRFVVVRLAEARLVVALRARVRLRLLSFQLVEARRVRRAVARRAVVFLFVRRVRPVFLRVLLRGMGLFSMGESLGRGGRRTPCPTLPAAGALAPAITADRTRHRPPPHAA